MLKQKLLLEDGSREVGEVADSEVDFAQMAACVVIGERAAEVLKIAHRI